MLLTTLLLPTFALAAACQPPPAAPPNDNFGAATLLTGAAQGQLAGSTVSATRQSGEPDSETAFTVWYRWTAPVSGAVSFAANGSLPEGVDAFTGTTLTGLHLISQDDDYPKAIFRTTAGTAYSIRVTGFTGSTFALRWSTVTAPANDRRASAAVINGSSGSLVGDSTAATTASVDPRIAGLPSAATVWYRWTAPASGWYDFDTNGSHLSTALGVYTDETPSRLVDDSVGSCASIESFGVSTASVGFSAVDGSSYLIMVGASADNGFHSGDLGGLYQLNWRPQVAAPVAAGNDAFATPTRISGTFGSINGTTLGATAEVGEPAHGSAPARSSVWFAWTPPVTADYVLNALPQDDGCGASLSVYSGTSLSTLKAIPDQNEDSSAVGLNDVVDGGGISGGFSFTPFGVEVHLVAGTTYRIAADRYFEPGPFTLHWDIPLAAPVIRSATPGVGSIGIIWSPPPRTAGSPLTGYFVAASPVDDNASLDSDSSQPLTLGANSTFATIHGLHNGTAYRVIVAAVNGSGLGAVAVTQQVIPARVR